MTSDESKTNLKMKSNGTASPSLALGGRAEKMRSCGSHTTGQVKSLPRREVSGPDEYRIADVARYGQLSGHDLLHRREEDSIAAKSSKDSDWAAGQNQKH